MILIVKDNSDDSYCKETVMILIVKETMIPIVKENSDDPYCKRQQ